MKTENEIVTDAELDAAWGNANFGDWSKREVIIHALEKVTKGYRPGSTTQMILAELGLSKNEWLTDKGYEYLIAASQSPSDSGRQEGEQDDGKYKFGETK